MKIVLASVQSDLRLALEMLFREQPGTDVVGTATETEGLLALIQTTRPDLVLLDCDLPGRPCAQVLAQIQTADCVPAFIILGRKASAEGPLLAAGAGAFVLKGDPPQRLLAAVERVRSQQRVYQDRVPAREE